MFVATMSSGDSSPGGLDGAVSSNSNNESNVANANNSGLRTAMRLGGGFVVDSSPERSSAGDETSPPSRFAPPAKVHDGKKAPAKDLSYTVQAPALVLTRSSAVSLPRSDGGRSATDGDDDGDHPVEFERPVYRNRPRLGADGDRHHNASDCGIGDAAASSVVYDRQDDIPIVPLWTEDPSTGNPTSTDCYAYISVGRKDMLMARFYGCGCLNNQDSKKERRQHETNNADSTKTMGTSANASSNAALKTKRKHVPAHGRSERLPLCATCKRIEKWGTAYLSREMIRLAPISNDGGDDGGHHQCRKTRFSLAVRGSNARMVRVDGIPIFDEDSQHHRDAMASCNDDDNGGGDGWVGNADLMAGSILSIECSPSAANAEGAVPAIGRLAFVLRNIDVAIEPGNSIDRDRSVRFDAVGMGAGGGEHPSSSNAQSKSCDRLPAPPIETTDLDAAIKKGSDDASGGGNIIDAQIEREGHSIAEKDIATIVLLGKRAKGESSTSKKDASRSFDEICSSEEDEPMLLLPTISKAKKKKVGSEKCDAIDLTDDAKIPKGSSTKKKSEIEILEIDDSPSDVAVAKSANERDAGIAHPPLVIYFLAIGRKMSHHRVKKLAENMRKKDPSVEIVDSFRKADNITHVVIDESVPAPQAADALGFVDEKGMAKVVRRRNLNIVTPKWVFDTDVNQLRSPPAMNFIWPGLQGRRSAKSKSKTDEREEKSNHDEEVHNKKSAFDESMMLSYQPLAQPDDTSVSSRDSVAEKSDEDFGSIKRVALSSLDDDDPAARMIKRKKVAARQYHNIGLFNMFLEVSKLHADSPVEELDNFKSKLYAKLAWRVKYLDFEINLANVGRLEEIDGFGKSAMKKIREFLMTKTCEKITAFHQDPLRVAIKNLTEIWGVGKTKAHSMARDGITNIDQVRKSLESGQLELSKNALLGVRYYDDLKERMERTEVDAITAVVLNVCRSIPGIEDVFITNQGSYRRGDERCGDADLLLVHPKFVDRLPKGGLGAIINKLEEQGHVCMLYFPVLSERLNRYENLIHQCSNSRSYSLLINPYLDE